MGYLAPTPRADNWRVPSVRPSIARAWLALLLALGQMLALAPAADAQQAQPQRVLATWTPKSVGPKELAGTCATDDFPGAPCPIVRGATYRTTVTVSVDQAVQSLIIQPV